MGKSAGWVKDKDISAPVSPAPMSKTGHGHMHICDLSTVGGRQRLEDPEAC